MPALPPAAAANLARLSRLQASPVNVLAQSLAKQSFKGSFAPGQRANVHGFGVSQPKPQVAKLGFDLGAALHGSKLIGSDLVTSALNAPAGVLAVGKAVGQDIGDAVQHPLQVQGSFARTRKLGGEIVQQSIHSLSPEQIRQHPGFAALTALAAASAGAGALSRVGAAGRAAAEAGSVGDAAKAALLRPGPQGGSLLHPAPPGETTLKLGGMEVKRLEPDNPLLRPLHRARTKAMQARLDNPSTTQPRTPLGKAYERMLSPENVVGREQRATARVLGDVAQGKAAALQAATKKLSPAEHTALRVAAIEGKGVYAHPAEAIQRHIDTHLEQAAQATSKAGAQLHQTIAADLKKAEPVLANPSRSFLRAARDTRRFSQQMTSEAIQRKLIAPESAKSSLQTLAEAYGHEGAPEGAFYFPTGDRFVLPTKPIGTAAYSPRPGQFGMPPPDKGRYTMGTLRRRTGTALHRGVVENVPKALAQAHVGRQKLYSAQDLFRQALRASTDTRTSEVQIPIRRSRAISPQLRRQVSIDLAKAQGGDQNALARVSKQLENELRADEHAKAPLGSKIPGVRWVDSRVLKEVTAGPQSGIARGFAAFNTIPRTLSVYARPAYLTTNYPQNLAMQALEQGFPKAAANLVRARRGNTLYGRDLMGAIRAAMGTTRTESFLPPTKGGLLRAGERKLVHGMTRATDQDARDMAFLFRARQRGFAGGQGLQKLLNDPAHSEDLAAVTRRARKDAVDFDSMTPKERELSSAIYFYPWMSRSTAWAGRAVANHPVKAALLAQEGRTPEAKRLLLQHAPSWTRGYLKLGGGVVNPNPVSPFSTQGQIAESLAHPGRNSAIATDFGTPTLQAISTPYKKIVGQILGQTAPALLAKRLGLTSVAGQSLEPLIGKPSKVFPETGVKAALGPFMLGGSFPRTADAAALQKSWAAELPRGQRFDVAMGSFRDAIVNESRKLKLLAPNEQLPQQIKVALALHQRRYEAYLKAKQSGSKLSELDRFKIDVGLLVSLGKATPAQRSTALRWAATAPDAKIQAERAGLSKAYFGSTYLNHAVKTLRDKGVKITVPRT